MRTRGTAIDQIRHGFYDWIDQKKSWIWCFYGLITKSVEFVEIHRYRHVKSAFNLCRPIDMVRCFVWAQNWCEATRCAEHRYNQLYGKTFTWQYNYGANRPGSSRSSSKSDKLVRQCKLYAFDGERARLIVCTLRVQPNNFNRSPFHAAIVSIFVDVMFCCVQFGIFLF